jgi:hypothetical protein
VEASDRRVDKALTSARFEKSRRRQRHLVAPAPERRREEAATVAVGERGGEDPLEGRAPPDRLAVLVEHIAGQRYPTGVAQSTVPHRDVVGLRAVREGECLVGHAGTGRAGLAVRTRHGPQHDRAERRAHRENAAATDLDLGASTVERIDAAYGSRPRGLFRREELAIKVVR